MAPLRFCKRSKAFKLHILVGYLVSFKNICVDIDTTVICSVIGNSCKYFILISACLVILPPNLVLLAVLFGCYSKFNRASGLL